MTTLTSPKRDFIGIAPPYGKRSRTGAFDGDEKLAYVVLSNPIAQHEVAEKYKREGFCAVCAATRDEFYRGLKEGLSPNLIVTDDLELVNSIRGLESGEQPPVPIYAVVQNHEDSILDAYMNGATMTITL